MSSQRNQTLGVLRHLALLAALPAALFVSCGGGDGGATETAAAASADGGAAEPANSPSASELASGATEGVAGAAEQAAQQAKQAAQEAAQTAKQAAADLTQGGHDAHDGHDHGPAVDAAAQKAAAQKAAAQKAAAQKQAAQKGTDAKLPPVLGDATGPRLVVPVGTDTHDFGRVMQGQNVEHEFEVKSDGTEPLVINQVKPTCGCTVAKVLVETDDGEMAQYTYGQPIPPGRRIHIPAVLHTKNKRGHQNTRINVFSNDPRGTTQLGLTADVEPFFNISPNFLNFGQISTGETKTLSATISTAQGQPIGLELATETLPPGAKAELTPASPDAEGRSPRWDLSVTLGPDLVEGNLARAILIQSDTEIPGSEPGPDGKPQMFQVSLTMSAKVVGPFSATPQYLSMGLVRPGQVVSRTVRIECHDKDFDFANFQPEVRIVGLPKPGTEEYTDWEYAQYFTPTVRKVEGENAIDVELTLEGLPDTVNGSFRGTLVLPLNHPDKKEIALAITGVCRGGAVQRAGSGG